MKGENSGMSNKTPEDIKQTVLKRKQMTILGVKFLPDPKYR
jgi:hypothetical protein